MFGNIREDLRQAHLFNHKGDAPWKAILHGLMHPGTRAVLLYRFGQWARKAPPGVRHLLCGIYYLGKLIVEPLTGVVLSAGAEIGPGFVVHSGFGVYVGRVKIGRCVVIQHGCVLAYGTGPVGDHCYFGAGAKVINGARIGDGVRIGANAVVVKDLPDGCTAVGVPAKLVRRHGDEEPSSKGWLGADRVPEAKPGEDLA